MLCPVLLWVFLGHLSGDAAELGIRLCARDTRSKTRVNLGVRAAATVKASGAVDLRAVVIGQPNLRQNEAFGSHENRAGLSRLW